MAKIRTPVAGLLCLALSSAAPAAAVTAYSIYDGDLVALDPATGAFEIIGDPAVSAVAA